MILQEFSKHLQSKNEDLVNGTTTTTKVLCDWIRFVIHKNPKNNIDKIIHKELLLAENKNGEFIIIGKSESGRVLANALFSFTKSYENYLMSRWLHDKKPYDFTE